MDDGKHGVGESTGSVLSLVSDGAPPDLIVSAGPGYRSTNLFRLATAWLRAFPDFVVVGAQKCGTTSFFEYMTSIPGVVAGIRRGIHFFDRLMYHRQPVWNDVLYYRSMFPFFWSGTPGETSPYYLFHPLAMERLAAMVPDTIVVVLLRDPVERAYSHYHHEVREGRENLSFEEAITRESERLAGEEERLTSNPAAHSFEYRHHSYLARGEYARQLQRVFSHYPRSNVVVIDSHRFFDSPRGPISRVLDALGIHPAMALEAETGHVARKGDYPDMDEDLKRRLRSRFAQHDRALRKLLGRSFSWM